MRPEIKTYLFDIQAALQSLDEFLRGKTFEDYDTSDFLRAAVERKLMIIGEAIHQAIHLCPELEQDIENARRIVDFRNILVHGYFAIENETVWGILQKDVPVLNTQIVRLLSQ